MTFFRQIALFIFLLGVGLLTPAYGSYFEWQVLENEYYKLYFHPDNKAKAVEALNELELSRPIVQQYVGNLPEKMPIVLEDVGQSSNGMVRLLPLRMNLFSEYPSQQPFRQTQYFLRLLTTHELVHAAHITEVSGLPEKLTCWLGDIFYSNIFSPRWYLEGLAVTVESRISPYDGRLNDPYQEAYFAYHAKHKTLQSLGQISLPMYTYLLGSTPYVYGGRFVNYLDETYGNESTQEFIKSYGKNPSAIASIFSPAFGFQDDIKGVYKTSTNALYKKWIKNEEEAYSDWAVSGEKVSHTGWYKHAILPYKKGVLVQETLYKHPSPFIYNPIYQVTYYEGSKKPREVFKSSRRLTAVPAVNGDTLYISRDYVKSGYENVLYRRYGAQSQITQVDLSSGSKKSRYIGPVTAFDANEHDELFIAMRKPGAYTTKILRVSDDEHTELVELPFAVSEIRLSEAVIYMVAKEKLGPWNIYKLPMQTLEPSTLFESPWAVYGLVVTEKGLSFTSNHNKERHLYEWDSNTNKIAQKSSGNDASLGVINKDKLHFVSFSQKGEDLYVSTPQNRPVNLSLNHLKLKPAQAAASSLSNSALTKSLEGLKEPSLKLFPFLYDEDDLGLVQYSTAYSSFSGLSAAVTSYHLNPVSVGIMHQYRRTYGVVQVPLYLAPNQRLFGIIGAVVSDFNETTLLQLAETSESRFGSTQTVWTKDTQEDEVLVQFNGSLYLGDSSLSVAYTSSEGNSFYDTVRGYHSELVYDEVAHNLRWDAKAKALEINKGLWIPPFAAGSLFVGGFSDYSSYVDRAASGAYLSIETKALLFESPIIISAGQSYSEGESRGFMTIEIDALF